MGWASYEHNGRLCGYAVSAKCDHKCCNKRIDRGLAYLCGGDFGKGCDGYFCPAHLYKHGCELPIEEDEPAPVAEEGGF